MYDKDNPLLDNPILMQVGAFSLVTFINKHTFKKSFSSFSKGVVKWNRIGAISKHYVTLMHGKDAYVHEGKV